MKKMHILGLVLIAGAIAALLTLMDDISTYDSIASARKKEGKFVHLIAKVDTSSAVIYDSTKVVYKNAKPTDFEKSQRVVMKGSMVGETFECQEIILKCPSKYTDEKGPGAPRMTAETPMKTTE